MRRRGATDWGKDGQAIADLEPDKLQLHHIFPFNFMAHNRTGYVPFEEEGYSPSDYRAEVNDIANLTILSQAKNVEIKDAPPWEYLPNETTREMRKAHFIPEQPELWRPENFEAFLKARRKMLSTEMTKLLKRL